MVLQLFGRSFIHDAIMDVRLSSFLGSNVSCLLYLRANRSSIVDVLSIKGVNMSSRFPHWRDVIELHASLVEREFLWLSSQCQRWHH